MVYGGWIAGAVVVLAAVATAAIVRTRRRLVVVSVDGASMSPTLESGDRVLVRRRQLDDVRVGDIVVLQSPAELVNVLDSTSVWNIKRVVALPGDDVPVGTVPAGNPAVVPAGKLVVIGDGAISSDSRQWGFYAGDRLLGVMIRQMSAR
ncbi:hypothetical protein GCM10009765_09790 [Fodinicola feengrottensis]|uniref:Signal peptidase I n=1 Tax=Fodinicola feengrottensis TaxID=435914 RepID=A0ABN2FZ04_9ACTN